MFVAFLPLHTVHATENNNIIEVRPEDYQISTMNLTDEDYDMQSVVIKSNLYKGTAGQILIPTNNIFLGGYAQYSGSIPMNRFGSSNTSAFEERIYIDMVDGSRMFAKNSQVNFTANNMINYVDLNYDGIGYRFYLDPKSVHNVCIWFKDVNGNYNTINADSFTMKRVGDYYTLECSAVTPIDAYGCFVSYSYNWDSAYGYGGLGWDIGCQSTRVYGFYNSTIYFEEQKNDGTKGLLANIIALVNNIKDGIVDLPGKIASSIKAFFDNVVNAVTNVMNAVTSIGDLIKNAIVNLGNFLLDGIKGLFVPSEEDITEMKDRWTDLLRDRFGALYQTVELIDSYGKSFQAQEKNSITMPSIDLSLAGAVFTFGGWEVQVVPDGFDVLFNALKLIISIVCTIWFVNGLKNRFEKLVGGADNI